MTVHVVFANYVHDGSYELQSVLWTEAPKRIDIGFCGDFWDLRKSLLRVHVLVAYKKFERSSLEYPPCYFRQPSKVAPF